MEDLQAFRNSVKGMIQQIAHQSQNNSSSLFCQPQPYLNPKSPEHLKSSQNKNAKNQHKFEHINGSQDLVQKQEQQRFDKQFRLIDQTLKDSRNHTLTSSILLIQNRLQTNEASSQLHTTQLLYRCKDTIEELQTELDHINKAKAIIEQENVTLKAIMQEKDKMIVELQSKVLYARIWEKNQIAAEENSLYAKHYNPEETVLQQLSEQNARLAQEVEKLSRQVYTLQLELVTCKEHMHRQAAEYCAKIENYEQDIDRIRLTTGLNASPKSISNKTQYKDNNLKTKESEEQHINNSPRDQTQRASSSHNNRMDQVTPQDYQRLQAEFQKISAINELVLKDKKLYNQLLRKKQEEIGRLTEANAGLRTQNGELERMLQEYRSSIREVEDLYQKEIMTLKGLIDKKQSAGMAQMIYRKSQNKGDNSSQYSATRGSYKQEDNYRTLQRGTPNSQSSVMRVGIRNQTPRTMDRIHNQHQAYAKPNENEYYTKLNMYPTQTHIRDGNTGGGRGVGVRSNSSKDLNNFKTNVYSRADYKQQRLKLDGYQRARQDFQNNYGMGIHRTSSKHI